MANDIKIYVQKGCPFCMRAILLLESEQVPYKKIDAPKGSKEREEAIRLSGGSTTVPQIFVNGKCLGGYEDIAALDKKGELKPILQGNA